MSHNKTFRFAVRKFGPFESAITKIWDNFCRETGCAVSLEMVPLDLHLLYNEILEQDGLKNGTWDVAHINTDWIYEAYVSGAVEDLKPYIDSKPPHDFPNGWNNSLLQMQQFNGHIIGLPFHDGPECLIYRKDLFEDVEEQKKFFNEYGRKLQPPETWDEFYTIAKFFQRPDKNLYGTVFAGYPDGHNTVFDFSLQLWTRNGDLLNENGEINIETDAALQGLTFYRTILKDSTAVHPETKDYDSVQAGMAFARGEVALMINWFGFASMCEVIEESRVKNKVDITNIPHGPGGKSASLNVYWLYAIGSGSLNKNLAYDFIRYATDRKNDKLLTFEGGIGCRISTWLDAEVNEKVPYYHKLALLHSNAKSLPRKSNWAKIASVIDEVVVKTITTNRSIKELLREGQEKIELLEQVANAQHTL